MRRIFQIIFLWLYIKVHSIMINISIALYNTEEVILKANPNITGEGGKIIQRKRHRNQLLEKFYAGQRDEKYVQDGLFTNVLKISHNCPVSFFRSNCSV